MSQNSSVAVLADCTDLYNSHISLTGLNGPPSVLSIENETILTNNTNVSPSQVIGSVSFQERVQSNDLAALFPRGSLNQKRIKKKKKSVESCVSTTESSENVSMDLDKSILNSFEGSKKMYDESPKLFNKQLYLRKKSVNISFESGSLNSTETEKKLEKSQINVSLKSKRRNASRSHNLTSILNIDDLESKEYSEETNESRPGSSQTNESCKDIQKDSAKVFKKDLYLRKKSVNISFDSGSLNNTPSNKNLENSPTNISLQSKRKNGSMSQRLTSVLNIDDLESSECSEENNESHPDSAHGNVSKNSETNESLKEIHKDSAKVFNKNLYLKKKSINISFDASSLKDSMIEMNVDPKSGVVLNSNDSINKLSKGKSITDNSTISNSSQIDGKENKPAKENIIHSNIETSDSFKAVSHDAVEQDHLDGNACSRKSIPDSINIPFSTINEELNESQAISVNTNCFNENTPQDDQIGEGNVSSSQCLKILTPKAVEQDCLEGNTITRKSKSIPNTINTSCNTKNKELNESQLTLAEGNSFIVKTSKDNQTIEGNHSLTNDSIKDLGDQEKNDESSICTTKSPNHVLMDKDKSVLDSIERPKKIEESAKVFNKKLYLRKKSVNISFESGSFNSTETEKKLDKRGINVSLQPRRRNASRSCKFNSVLNNDDLESKECSEETNISRPGSTIGNISKLSDTNESCIDIHKDSAKVFKKDLYLKKKSVNISFDLGSLNNTESDEKLENSPINVSLQREGKNASLSQRLNSDLNIDNRKSSEWSEETDKSHQDSAQGRSLNESISKISETNESLKEIHKDSAKVFNKNLYLKKKSINISFDASSLEDSMVEKTVNPKSGVLQNINDTMNDLSKGNVIIDNTTISNSSQIDSEKNKSHTENVKHLNIITSDSWREMEHNSVGNDCLDGNGSSIKLNSIPDPINISCCKINKEVNKSQLTPAEGNSFIVKTSKDNQTIKGNHSSTLLKEYSEETNISCPGSSEGNISKLSEISESCKEIHEKDLTKVFKKDLYLKKKSINISFDLGSLNNTESDEKLENSPINVSLQREGKNASLSQRLNSDLNIDNCKSSEWSEDTDKSHQDSAQGRSLNESISKISKTNESLKEIHKDSAKVFNKNLYLKKKSINISFDASSLKDLMVEKTVNPKGGVLQNINDTMNDLSKGNVIIDNTTISNSSQIDSGKNKSHTENVKHLNIITSDSWREMEHNSVGNDCLDGNGSSIKLNSIPDPINISCCKINKEVNKSHLTPAEGNSFIVKTSKDNQTIEGNHSSTLLKEYSEETNISCPGSSEGNISKLSEISESCKEIHEKDLTKVFKKDLYLKKKSVNISFDLGSLNNTESDEKLENSPINVSLQREGKNASLSQRLNSDLNIDNRKSSEWSEDTDKSHQDSAQGRSLNESISKISETNESLKEIHKDSAKVFNKNLYLKKKSINISFDASSLKDSMIEKNIDPKSGVVLNSNDSINNLSKEKSITDNTTISNSSQIYSGKNKPAKENIIHSNIKTSDSFKAVTHDAVVQDHLDGNASSIEYTSKDDQIAEGNHSSTAVSGDHNNEVVLKNVVKENADPESIKIKDVLKEQDISKSSEINNDTINNKKKNKSATENSEDVNISISHGLKVMSQKIVKQDCSVGNSISHNTKSIPSSINISSSKINEDSKESRTTPAEGNCVNENMFQDNLATEGCHSSRNYSNVDHSDHGPSSCFNNVCNEQEKNEEVASVKEVKKTTDMENLNAIDFLKECNVSESSKINNASINNEEKNKSATDNSKCSNNVTSHSLEIIKKKTVGQYCAGGNSSYSNAKSIRSSINISNNKINEDSNECETTPAEENCCNKKTSQDNQTILDNHSSTNNSNVNLRGHESSSCFNYVHSDREKNDDLVSEMDAKEINDKENLNAIDILKERNVSKSSKTNNVSINNEEKNETATENRKCSNNLTSHCLEIINQKEIEQDFSGVNSNSSYTKSIPNSINISSNKINEDSKESQTTPAEENCFNENTSKENQIIEVNNSSTNNSIVDLPDHEPSFNNKHKDKEKNDELVSDNIVKKNTDKENLKVVDVLKECSDSKSSEINSVNNNNNEEKNKSTAEISMKKKKSRTGNYMLRNCSTISPSKAVGKRSIDSEENLYTSENSSKKNKTSLSGSGNEDFIKDISIIPNPKRVTRSKVMYHSTPITREFTKKKRSKLRDSTNIKVEDNKVQQDDKMIQVSKSIFGSSTEVTNATVSKKKSLEFSSVSTEKSDNRAKRKSDSHHTGVKLQKLESIAESRSYHSNFLSTFEDDVSYCTPRKSLKRVAFKSISSQDNSTSGYGNSSDDCASRNRKSVGFRDAVSIIENTTSNSSEGVVRDANNSNFSVPDLNSIRINETPLTINESKNRIDKNDISLNYSTEVPEIILTENEIEPNEISEECSLFNKLIEMAESKKANKSSAKRQANLPKGRKKLRRSNSVIINSLPIVAHREKWVSPNLIKFLNNKLMTDDLDHVINTERIVSILCSAVSAVRNLQDVNDIDFALLPLKSILLKFRVCCNMIEYCTFISRFTPFEFQRKTLPLEGYFGSCKRGINKKLTDPILTETEKMNIFL